jgi:hypothetical protein
VVVGGLHLIGKPPKNTFCRGHSCGRKRALSLPAPMIRRFVFFGYAKKMNGSSWIKTWGIFVFKKIILQKE